MCLQWNRRFHCKNGLTVPLTHWKGYGFSKILENCEVIGSLGSLLTLPFWMFLHHRMCPYWNDYLRWIRVTGDEGWEWPWVSFYLPEGITLTGMNGNLNKHRWMLNIKTDNFCPVASVQNFQPYVNDFNVLVVAVFPSRAVTTAGIKCPGWH